ncbi:MAG TPA: GNAT family N-acetyltransferase, partial [Candidatus Limnocylindrales bacterium]
MTGDSLASSGTVRRVATGDLSDRDVAAIRSLLWRAFPEGEEAFTEDDWRHAIGGVHFVLELDAAVVAHASVVGRELHLGDRAIRAGYVEAVATDPDWQGRGLGTRVMRDVGSYIVERFELGALGTGSHHFYERLGWLTWRGPSFVRTAAGLRGT